MAAIVPTHPMAVTAHQRALEDAEPDLSEAEDRRDQVIAALAQHSPSLAANLASILGGILVFRDPIGIGALAIVGRVIAFGLVIAGTAFMPAPQRAARPPGPSPAARQA